MLPKFQIKLQDDMFKKALLKGFLNFITKYFQCSVEYYIPTNKEWSSLSKHFEKCDSRYIMAEEVLKNVLEWCFKNTNIIEAKDNEYHGDRLIHYAASNGYVSVLKQLLEKGVSPDLKNDRGLTPLHHASLNEDGHNEVAKLLLQKGADPNSLSRDKNTPIYFATETGNAEIVKLLIQNGANVNSLNKDNTTPLHVAAALGDLEISKMLIENGANVESSDEEDWTPLHFASLNGHLEVVKLQLEFGANIECQTKIMQWMPIFQAIENGHVEIVQFLLQKGTNVNCLSKSKNTPLHNASKLGHSKIVEMLIQNRSNLNSENGKRNTPLHLASEFGQSEVVKILLERNICLTLKNNAGKTAIEVAKEKNHKKIYRMIYEKIVESMSSKGNSTQCSNDECQREMKRLILDKVDDAFSPNDGKTCVVCFEEKNGTFALLPCGHAKTCQKCCDKIVRETKKCPLCRENVSKYQKIYD